MDIPAQVQAAADKSDEIMRQLSGDQEGGEGGERTTVPETSTAGTDLLADGHDAGTSKQSTTERPEDFGRDDSIQQENESLARLNRSLDNENRHLKIKCSGLEREVSELKERITELESGAANNVSGSGDGLELTDDERAVLEEEGLSEEAIKILMKRATSQKNPKIGELEQKVDTIVKSTEEMARERFFNELKTVVPEWETINTESGFLEMMNELVPYQTYTFQDLLDHANSRNDSATVARIFSDYKAKRTTAAPGQQEPRRKSLNDIVEPTQSKTVIQPKPQDGVKWNGEEIRKFYDEIQRNPGKYTREQIAEIEAKHIFRA